MSRRVTYVGPSCGRHVEEPSNLYLFMRALGFGLLTLASGGLLWVIIWLAFGLGPGP